MKYFYDLHMHTALSPCGDPDMTPNNIVNMSLINGLDIIAVTDHNSAENVCAVMEAAKNTELCVVPGMEVATQEEFHSICLFETLSQVLELQQYVYSVLPPVKNKPEIFGVQHIMDMQDNVVGECDKLLISAAEISVYELAEFVKKIHGAMLPAHIDRQSYSIIMSLGFIPEDLPIKYVEISKATVPEILYAKNTYLQRYKYIQSSDAHYLENISEAQNQIDLPYKNAKEIVKKLSI